MRTTVVLLSLSSAILLGAPLLADDVYLKNGRTFENVVVEDVASGSTQVRIHIQGGVISLPLSAIDRVKKADSTFAEFLRREAELRSYAQSGPTGVAHPDRLAADWLDLARWARANHLPQGEREAALAAAEINPQAPGLPALLRGFGYVYEEAVDRWVSYDDSMRMHGFVQDGGAWVSREELAARMRDRVLASRDAAARAAAANAAAAEENAEYALAQQQAQMAGAYAGGGYDLGGFYGYWPFGASPLFSAPVFSLRRGLARHRPGAGAGAMHHEHRPTGVFGVPPGRAVLPPVLQRAERPAAAPGPRR